MMHLYIKDVSIFYYSADSYRPVITACTRAHMFADKTICDAPTPPPKVRIEYPEWINKIDKAATAGKFYIYMLKTEICDKQLGYCYYKFGITTSLHNRLKKHYRDMKFLSIVHIFECVDEYMMKEIEARFKKEAGACGILRMRYNKTEIIYVCDINPYIEWLQRSINAMAANPDYQRRLIEHKLQRQNAAGPVNHVSKLEMEELRAEFRQEVDKLRLLYRSEIERLEKKINDMAGLIK
jgi:hypothetical protein